MVTVYSRKYIDSQRSDSDPNVMMHVDQCAYHLAPVLLICLSWWPSQHFVHQMLIICCEYHIYPNCFGHFNSLPYWVQLFKTSANVTLKCLSWNMANTLSDIFAEKWVVFALQKLLIFFCSKNINVFENTVATTVKQFVMNKLVKLMMLWTTGPWS